MNWFDRIAALEAGCTKEEHQAATDLAHEWTTCMCGQQDAAIPRWQATDDLVLLGQMVDGAPKDRELRLLGCEFASHIEEREWDGARCVGELIQIRAAWVLANLNTETTVEQHVHESA